MILLYLCLHSWLCDVLKSSGYEIHVRGEVLNSVLELEISKIRSGRDGLSRYVGEHGEDGQAVPVARLQGSGEAPSGLLVVEELDLHGEGDSAPGVLRASPGEVAPVEESLGEDVVVEEPRP